MSQRECIINESPEAGRDPRGCVCGCLIMAAAVAITLALILLFPSCASSRQAGRVNVRDSTVYNYRDSTVYHYRDSVRMVEQRVTVYDSAGLVIRFGASGGTYNANTGEATNVAGVRRSDTRLEHRDSTAFYRQLSGQWKTRSDSLSQCVADYKSELSIERERPKRTGYDRFCSRWFWLTAVWLLLKTAVWILERVPSTAPWVALVRKFVPLL